MHMVRTAKTCYDTSARELKWQVTLTMYLSTDASKMVFEKHPERTLTGDADGFSPAAVSRQGDGVSMPYRRKFPSLSAGSDVISLTDFWCLHSGPVLVVAAIAGNAFCSASPGPQPPA